MASVALKTVRKILEIWRVNSNNDDFTVEICLEANLATEEDIREILSIAKEPQEDEVV